MSPPKVVHGTDTRLSDAQMNRTFRCNQCNSSFHRSAHLRRHQQIHRAEKPFTCSYCPVSSSRKDVIIRHTRNFHPDQLPQNSGGRIPMDLHPGRLPEHEIAVSTGGSSRSPPDARRAPAGLEMDCEDFTATLGFGAFEGFSGFLSPSASGYLGQLEPLTSDIRLSPAGQSITACNEAVNLRSDPLQPPSAHDTPSSDVDSYLDTPAGLNVDDYQKVRANLALLDTGSGLENLRFPSRYAVCRFVTAFFDHMATHFPIIHRPTFDMTKVPIPLLLEILASGALYSREHDIANNLNATALRIMSELGPPGMAGNQEAGFQLWTFQFNLLASYFATYNEPRQPGPNILPLLSRCVKLSEDAVSKFRSCNRTTWTDWVYQETISRCIAGTVILTAAINSTAAKPILHSVDLDTGFPLPSTTITWLNDGSHWDASSVQTSSSTSVLGNILAGEELNTKISTFSLLTIVAAILSYICSFEAVATSQHADLYTSFVNKMEKPVRLLNGLWNAQGADTSYECGSGSVALHAPLMKAARSLLDSAVFHLHGARQLRQMKWLLDNNVILRTPNEVERLFGGPFPTSLNEALLSAAKSWRSDIRRGLKYLQRVCQYRVSPLSCTALLEGSLLLCWYLEMNRFDLTTAAGNRTSLEILLWDSITELEGLGRADDTEASLLPLMAAADLLGDDPSVWQWPLALAGNIRQLIQQLKEIHARRRISLCHYSTG
ncbi:hypothetical protein AJ79_10194 [Helicocarpus griseus UAMH5409]|uniref:C2H2-type domain-containing protein n=1 Tax=Helicocarpus griseus UAMH5409 TaxID=1447875 RepID=A0A2B7WF33_9EURO|nr:hypothetical protein AJ79_10194 [Helicocarpus griseus UAMH5409]